MKMTFEWDKTVVHAYGSVLETDLISLVLMVTDWGPALPDTSISPWYTPGPASKQTWGYWSNVAWSYHC